MDRVATAVDTSVAEVSSVADTTVVVAMVYRNGFPVVDTADVEAMAVVVAIVD